METQTQADRQVQAELKAGFKCLKLFFLSLWQNARHEQLRRKNGPVLGYSFREFNPWLLGPMYLGKARKVAAMWDRKVSSFLACQEVKKRIGDLVEASKVSSQWHNCSGHYPLHNISMISQNIPATSSTKPSTCKFLGKNYRFTLEQKTYSHMTLPTSGQIREPTWDFCLVGSLKLSPQ